MGTRLAPSFANLFMYHFEEKYVYPTINNQKFGSGTYMDDICMILDHGIDDLNQFISHLNGSNKNITLSSEISPVKLNFLDVTLKLVENQIVTGLYTKPS